MEIQKKWIKKGTCTNFAEYVMETTGKSIDEISQSQFASYECPGIKESADMIRQAIADDREIHVIVDYDADGINSGAEIYMILKKLGATMKIIVPKRKKDGYGINTDMVINIPDHSLIITIDNGITGVTPIADAKERGIQVLVLDHHEQNGPLPNADLIVDPEAFPEGWTFSNYCGAGITYKLAQYLFPDDKDFLAKLSCFAAIATIGDSVNVTGDNRNIVREGLMNMNRRNCTEGLNAILDVLKERDKIEHFGDYELAYKIAPMINAPGRLDDDGGVFVLGTLFRTGEMAKRKAEELYDLNEKRKEMVNTAIETLQPKGEKIAFLYSEDLEEGLCGIIAGHLASDLHKPAFVMTKAEGGLIKGSARSEGSTDVLALLTEVKDRLVRFGGHKPAAGFSFEEKEIKMIFRKLEKKAPEAVTEEIMYYDFDAEVRDLYNIMINMNKIEIFGVGLPRPVIRIRSDIQDVRTIGQDKTHLSFKLGDVKAVAFSMAEKYQNMNCPTNITVYGNLSENWWRGKASMQFQVSDIDL